jgi:hypothetical protein
VHCAEDRPRRELNTASGQSGWMRYQRGVGTRIRCGKPPPAEVQRQLGAADALAIHLMGLVQRDGILVDLDIPVPLGRKRQRERGYNQVALLARPIAAAMGLPYNPGTFKVKGDT